MNTLLLVMTALSTTVAVVASVVALRLWSEARARADARLAALTAEIAPQAPEIDTDTEAAAPLADDALADPAPFVPELFATARTARDGDAARRLVPVAAVGAIALCGVLGVLLLAGGRSVDAARPSASVAPLELVALRHTQQDGTTRIAGTVRNPAGAPVRGRVNVVVSFVDARGDVLTVRRAPLAAAQLAPGSESAFEVEAAAPAGAVRYRVGFRQDGMGPVPHVDRRAGD